MNKIEKVDTLLKTCNDFRTELSANEVWNINPEVNAPDYIDPTSDKWRVFRNQILSLDKLIGQYDNISAIKAIVSSISRIDDAIIQEIIVALNELKIEIEIESAQISIINPGTCKSTLEILLYEMEELKSEFIPAPKIPGMPTPNKTIYKSHKFLLWRSKVINELCGNIDQLSQNILSELNSFNGWRDEKIFENIKAELTVLVENEKIKDETTMNMQIAKVSVNEKPHKLFISHSSDDKEYMLALVEMLEEIGMPDGSFVCTSIPGHGIPGGMQIFEWLRMQFLNCNLRVLFVLSKNYYNSAACLNEMGAAWITKAEDTLLLLPGFNFSDIKGCVDAREIGISFEASDDELKHRLNEFKETLILEHSLKPITQARWERNRDRLIDTIREISARKKKLQIIKCIAMDYIDLKNNEI